MRTRNLFAGIALVLILGLGLLLTRSLGPSVEPGTGTAFETISGNPREVSCADVSLPLFNGRVNRDQIGYSASVEERVLNVRSNAIRPDEEPRDYSIPTDDQLCLSRLPRPVRAFLETVMAACLRDGGCAADPPGGP